MGFFIAALNDDADLFDPRCRQFQQMIMQQRAGDAIRDRQWETVLF